MKKLLFGVFILLLAIAVYKYLPHKIPPTVVYSPDQVKMGVNEVDCNWPFLVSNDFNEIQALFDLAKEKARNGQIRLSANLASNKCEWQVKAMFLSVKALDIVLTPEEKAIPMSDLVAERVPAQQTDVLGASDDETTVGEVLDRLKTIEITTM